VLGDGEQDPWRLPQTLPVGVGEDDGVGGLVDVAQDDGEAGGFGDGCGPEDVPGTARLSGGAPGRAMSTVLVMSDLFW
jgi:hypothetical protein